MEQGTADQNPHHQVNTLLWARADREKTHMDKVSGAKAPRLKLDLVLQLLRERVTLKATRLDRLSLSALHLETHSTRWLAVHRIRTAWDQCVGSGRDQGALFTGWDGSGLPG